MHFASCLGRCVAFLLVCVAVQASGSPRANAQVESSLPDLNGDGVADYFMRLPVWSTTDDVVGQFRVFSGVDNTLIKGFASLQIDDGFGVSTSSAGDLNADGVDDLLVGAPLAVSDGVLRGKVYAISGLDGTILDVITGSAWSYTGMTVAGLGDVDGGGLRDIAYSTRGATGAVEDTGFVVVHSTDAGEPMLTLRGSPGDTSFGYAIAYLGDTNADGGAEIALSAPMDGGGANTRGSVYVFECRDQDGSLRVSQGVADARLVISNTALPSAVFGGAMFLGPDIDGDGHRELIVGSTIFLESTEIAVLEAYDLSTGQRVASLSIDAQKLNSDINGDLVVDHRDVAEILDRMNEPADPLDPKSGDLDGDGLVGAGDVVSVIGNLDDASITPATFSNGHGAEVTDMVASLLPPRIHPCFGVGVGPGGGVGGIAIPPDGPGGGATIPDTPLTPETVACCLYRYYWLFFDPDDPPPPPPGCDDDDDGSEPGGNEPPRPRPPGWTGGPGGGGDDPPDCDGMSILGPTVVEVGTSASFTVSGNPAGFLMWDVYPYPTPLILRPLVISTRPVYSVQGFAVGQGMVIARVYENGQVVCGESFPVQVVDCEQMTVDGPGAVSVGAEVTYSAQNLGAGMTVEWTVSGKLAVVSTSPESVTVRGSSPGSGRVSARALYQNEPLTCQVDLDVAVGCDFSVSGPVSLADGQTAGYIAQEQYPGQTVVWSASGPLTIVGANTGWSVQVQGSGCGSGVLSARLHDAEGVFLGCVAETPITVPGPATEPLALSGLPATGYVQLTPWQNEQVVTLTATGVGEFEWIVESSVEDAVQVSAAGATCTLTIVEATRVSVRVVRDFCDESIEVEAGFSAIVFDLAIDSDNDGVITLADDAIETEGAGHILLSNTLDADADGIPDYADGIGLMPGYAAAETLDDGEFSPVLVTLSDLEGLPFNGLDLTYNASDPAGIHVSDTEFFARPNGLMRLWRVPANVARSPLPVFEGGDYVPPGLYTLDTLGLSAEGGEVTLYLEAIRPTPEVGGGEIQVELVAFGADAGADGPAEGPSDLVVLTTTEIEIYGRGKNDNQQYLSSIIWATVLETLDEEEGEEPLPPDSSILPGAFSVHQVRVIDPRAGLTGMEIDGQHLPLIADGLGGYTTPEFLAIDPDTPPDALNPSGLPLIRLSGDLTATFSYNPSGKQKVARPLEELSPGYKKLASLINDDIVRYMQVHWTPTPNDPGGFGKEVHRRVAEALQGNRNYLCDVVIHIPSRMIMPSSMQGGEDLAQIDVMHVKRGYRPAVGDTLDLSKVKMAYEIKGGMNGLSSNQIAYYPGLFGDQGVGWDLVRSRLRWTATNGWIPVPIMNDEMPRISRHLRGADVIGPGLALGAMIVHGFYGSDERDIAVSQAVVAFQQGANASSQAIMLSKALTAFEHLQEYFGSFSNGNSGVTLGLTIGIVEFIKRN